MLREGDRIHYSGDLANDAGWFVVTVADEFGRITAQEDGGERLFHMSAEHIGNVYRGHCSPRFVTEAAYRAFYAAPGATLGGQR